MLLFAIVGVQVFYDQRHIIIALIIGALLFVMLAVYRLWQKVRIKELVVGVRERD